MILGGDDRNTPEDVPVTQSITTYSFKFQDKRPLLPHRTKSRWAAMTRLARGLFNNVMFLLDRTNKLLLTSFGPGGF